MWMTLSQQKNIHWFIKLISKSFYNIANNLCDNQIYRKTYVKKLKGIIMWNGHYFYICCINVLLFYCYAQKKIVQKKGFFTNEWLPVTLWIGFHLINNSSIQIRFDNKQIVLISEISGQIDHYNKGWYIMHIADQQRRSLRSVWWILVFIKYINT